MMNFFGTKGVRLKKLGKSSIQVDDKKYLPCRWMILTKRLSIQEEHLPPPTV